MFRGRETIQIPKNFSNVNAGQSLLATIMFRFLKGSAAIEKAELFNA